MVAGTLFTHYCSMVEYEKWIALLHSLPIHQKQCQFYVRIAADIALLAVRQ